MLVKKSFLICLFTSESFELTDERYVLQERVAIQEEYRVHTIESNVIPNLTYRRYNLGSLPSEREWANQFVQHALDRLPWGLLKGSLCAWDVAQTTNSAASIIEINFAGVHPTYVPTFHCSGYFAGPWGPVLMARLIHFVEKRYEIKISIDADVSEEDPDYRTYETTARWKALLCLDAEIQTLLMKFPSKSSLGTQTKSHADAAFAALMSRLDRTSLLLATLR